MGDRCEPTLCGGPAQAKRSCSRWLLTSACAVADCAAAACKFVPAWRAVTNDTAYIVMEGVTWGDDGNARPCRRAGAGRQPRGVRRRRLLPPWLVRGQRRKHVDWSRPAKRQGPSGTPLLGGRTGDARPRQPNDGHGRGRSVKRLPPCAVDTATADALPCCGG